MFGSRDQDRLCAVLIIWCMTMFAAVLPAQEKTMAEPEAATITVSPTEIDDPLVNPFMGWGIWAGPRFLDGRQFSIDYCTTGFGDDAPLCKLVLVDWMWSDLEPKEGQYAWQHLRRVVDYWGARDKQLLVRLWVTTDPGWGGAAGNKACPDWLWDAGVSFHSYKGEGGVTQRCPAYADPSFGAQYLPRLRRFLTAYRDAFHKPGSPIVLDQVMGFGDWGEWHTMWSHYRWPDRQTKRAVLANVIETYAEIFAPDQRPGESIRNLCIAHVYDDDCKGETPVAEAIERQALDQALSRGFALSRHGFVDGLFGWPQDVIAQNWQNHQLLAEADWTYDQVKDDKTHGTMQEHLQAFNKCHSTYVHLYLHSGSYKRAMQLDRALFERGLQAGGIGYRFVLSKARWEAQRSPGQTLTLTQSWANRNVSWCVYPYRLRVDLVDAGGREVLSAVDQRFDPRSWVQANEYAVSSRFELPTTLPAGLYKLRVALVDAAGKPAVRLGIAGGDDRMRYLLGALGVRAR